MIATGKMKNTRSLLFAALLVSLLGTGTELLLIGHFEGWWQLLPLLLIGLALALLAWFRTSRSASSKKVFQGLMALFLITGILGFALHYDGNMAFELEMYPGMKGGELIWETLQGATPVLAPGSMIATGLLGWAYTHF